MAEAKFFQCELREVKGNIIDHVYPRLKKDPVKPTLEQRLPNGGACPDCGKKEWMIFPVECVAVREGGKPYIECLGCGHTTHL